MPANKRSKRASQPVDEMDTEMDEDCLPTHLDEWKNASKAVRSRLAAKWRRDKEVEYLDKLSNLLPLTPNVTEKLDKGSILRLTISYLQIKNDLARRTSGTCKPVPSCLTNGSRRHGDSTNGCQNGSSLQMLRVNESELLLHALGGFLIFVSRKGRIMYVSENVTAHLGFNQYDMVGKKILTFIHQDDLKELTKQFMISQPTSLLQAVTFGDDQTDDIDDEDPDAINPDTFVHERKPFYLRMRYQITKKNSKTKHSGYLLSQWSGRIRLAPSKTTAGHSSIIGMVAICRPLQSTSVLEIRLDGNMFMSRHNLDMKFIYCDPRILTLIGYEPTELVGKNAYHFHNPLDASKIQTCHSNLIVRGQSVSKYYRFLGKTGEWVWMQTRATVIYNTTNQPQYVVCMNYVIGQDEGRRHLMMEQEDLKDQDIAKGAIDVTSLSSPGPAHSSGYCSADEDHSYSSSKTRETYSPGTPGTHSSIETSSQPCTPPSIHSPNTHGPAPNMVTPTMLEEKMQEFNTDELNLFDMIGEMLPPNSLPTSSNLPTDGVGSLADSWLNSLDNDIEMMDVDQNNGLPPPLDVSTDADGLLINMLKNSEKNTCLQSGTRTKGDLGSSPIQNTTGINNFMTTPSTSAVITQSNVMLSSATMGQTTGAMSCSSGVTNMMQLKNTLLKGSSVSMPVSSSMDSSLMGRIKASMTVAEFPQSLLAATDGDPVDTSNEFALKFAENMVDQQINATLANYLNDGDTLMDGSSLGVQDSGLTDVQDAELTDSPFNILSDAVISNSSSLSQFLTSSNPIARSASSPIITSSSRLKSYHVPSSIHSTKQTIFVTPKAPPPLSAQTRQISTSKSHPVSPPSRTVSQPPLHKVSVTASSGSKTQGHTFSAYPGCDDHRYTSKQLDSPPHKSNSHRSAHRSNNSYRHHNSHSNHNHSSSHNHNHSNSHQPRLLEKFLLTKEKLNPNKGSDAALATHGLSQLHLGEFGGRGGDQEILDCNQQLLKKLLTEEIQPKDVHKAQQEVIMDRRQSAGSSPTCGSPTLMNSFILDADDLSNSIQLLGEDNTAEMDKLWAPPSGDESMTSELDEILREEMRQNDLWLQHCINELL